MEQGRRTESGGIKTQICTSCSERGVYFRSSAIHALGMHEEIVKQTCERAGACVGARNDREYGIGGNFVRRGRHALQASLVSLGERWRRQCSMSNGNSPENARGPCVRPNSPPVRELDFLQSDGPWK